jgi:uncharacterized DUF497 family protein
MYYEGVEIEFDSVKARANLRKHKVDFTHAEQALRDPRAISLEDPDSIEEHRFVTIGMDSLGRLMVVVHTPRGGRVRLILARKATKRETRIYNA